MHFWGSDRPVHQPPEGLDSRSIRSPWDLLRIHLQAQWGLREKESEFGVDASLAGFEARLGGQTRRAM